ncbi:hypothetical protein SALBM217S_00414 [Streptomyces griseoloalbus]
MRGSTVQARDSRLRPVRLSTTWQETPKPASSAASASPAGPAPTMSTWGDGGIF